MVSFSDALKEIAAIDRLIDANRYGAKDAALESDLFRQRGDAQLRRDDAVEANSLAAARRPVRTHKCPTCGQHTLAKLSA